MVLMVTGSYPPDVCGVGDYSYNLINTEEARDWKLFYKKDWRLRKLPVYIHNINKEKFEKIIFQYPTQGYGWSIVPFLLMIYYSVRKGEKCIAVYHEFTNRSKKARFVQNLALYFVKNAVVTNEFEKKEIRRYHKKLQLSVIKIFSNIERARVIKPFSERKTEYCYFGQIRPEKGIEEYLEFLKRVTCNRSNCLLMGMIPRQFEDYGNKIVNQARHLGIQIRLDVPAREASDVLADTKCLVLLFPDGLSERRGSFMAGAINGCLIFSTAGKYTTKELAKCIYKRLPDDYEKIYKTYLSCNDRKWQKYFDIVNTYFEKNLPHSWDDVVRKYNEI